jgi:predicted nucleic acid-binding protein
MKYVLDSSVALKWVLAEPDSGRAIRLRDEYNASIHELLAPDFFIPEIANGVAVAERQGRITGGQAAIFFHDIIRNAPAIHPTPFLLIRAIEISLSTNQAVYDCIYVALAEREGCQMVSADDQLVRKLRPLFPFMIRLADIP